MVVRAQPSRKTELPYGSYARIARRLKVSLNHVRLVATGERRSPRVERALARLAARVAQQSSAA